MIEEHWFATPIWYVNNILNKEQFDQTLKFTNYIKNIDKGRFFTNVGGFQSNDIFLEDYLQYNLDFFPEVMLKKANEAFLNLSSPIVLNKIYSWININSKNNYNNKHNHPCTIFTGVYYLTEGSDITFCRPSGEMDYYLRNTIDSGFGGKESNYNNYEYVIYKPKPNMALFFPPFLKHGVEVSESENDRISIAFNFT